MEQGKRAASAIHAAAGRDRPPSALDGYGTERGDHGQASLVVSGSPLVGCSRILFPPRRSLSPMLLGCSGAKDSPLSKPRSGRRARSPRRRRSGRAVLAENASAATRALAPARAPDI
ncbi:unnamed protein product [Coccothraustes coccothraustes]